jgi:hypothetical protein
VKIEQDGDEDTGCDGGLEISDNADSIFAEDIHGLVFDMDGKQIDPKTYAIDFYNMTRGTARVVDSMDVQAHSYDAAKAKLLAWAAQLEWRLEIISSRELDAPRSPDGSVFVVIK